MRLLLSVFLFFTCHLHSNNNLSLFESGGITSDLESLGILEDCVSLASGTFIQNESLIHIEGEHSISLSYHYNSSSNLENYNLAPGICTNYPIILIYNSYNKCYFLGSREGSYACFKWDAEVDEGRFDLKGAAKNGYTIFNETGKGLVQSRLLKEGNKIVHVLGNGTRLIYSAKKHLSNQAYYSTLEKEIRKNGTTILYSYDENRLSEIRSCSADESKTFHWIKIDYTSRDKKISASNGQKIVVLHQKQKFRPSPGWVQKKICSCYH